MATHIHDVGLRAVIRNGERGFRVVVGGGLGPLPSESRLLDEFLPVERVVNRVEAVLRVFNKYGNRGNKNKARFKFIIRERGWDWTREQIDKEYETILRDGGIAMPESVPEGFGGFQSTPPPLGTGDLLPILGPAPIDPEYDVAATLTSAPANECRSCVCSSLADSESSSTTTVSCNGRRLSAAAMRTRKQIEQCSNR